jgi:hypothetical protein
MPLILAGPNNFQIQEIIGVSPSLLGPISTSLHDDLVQLFLGIPHHLAVKFQQAVHICNDAWIINLRSQQTEGDILVEAFLRGFAQAPKEKEWKGSLVNITDELKTLLKVYEDSLMELNKRKDYKMATLVGIMREFIEVHDKTRDLEIKISALKDKMNIDEDEQGDNEHE